MKKNIFLFTILLTISSFSSNASLTGEMKNVFATSFYDTCIKNKILGFNKAQIESYCKCSKNYVVKNINEEDIFEVGEESSQDKESISSLKAVQVVKASAAYCIKKVK